MSRVIHCSPQRQSRKQGAEAIPLCASKQHNVQVLTKQSRVQLQHFPAPSKRCSVERCCVGLTLSITGLKELLNSQTTQVIFCYCQPEMSQVLRCVIPHCTDSSVNTPSNPNKLVLRFGIDLQIKELCCFPGQPTLPQEFDPPAGF